MLEEGIQSGMDQRYVPEPRLDILRGLYSGALRLKFQVLQNGLLWYDAGVAEFQHIYRPKQRTLRNFQAALGAIYYLVHMSNISYWKVWGGGFAGTSVSMQAVERSRQTWLKNANSSREAQEPAVSC